MNLRITPFFNAALAIPLLVSAEISISDPQQGIFNFTAASSGLSGITWQSGSTYFAVSDQSHHVEKLSIALNSLNGRISSVVAQSRNLVEGFDLEGIAWSAPRNHFFIADEGQAVGGGFLRVYRQADWIFQQSIPLANPMQNTRSNFGLESCAWGAGALWTANEEALAHESAPSTATSGSMVRLQKYNHQLAPVAQWAYMTDSFDFDHPLTNLERGGVSDILALPDGNLLVLERTLGGSYGFRNRIYRVDFSQATDVSQIADLDGASFIPVSKTLLWEKIMPFPPVQTHNFEGITLGPALPAISDTSYSLLLIADNGSGTQQHLYPLILNGLSAPLPMAQWRQAFWGSTLATGVAADDADPDLDGIKNILEYALGGDPNFPDAQLLTQWDFADGRLSLTFARNPNRGDISLSVQASDHLNNPWDHLAQSIAGAPTLPILDGVTVTESGEGVSRQVTVKDVNTASSRRFMRLKATR